MSNAISMSRHSRRLLETLASDGAVGRESAVRPGHIAVAASRAGITTVVASLPADAATPLIERDLANWRDGALVITDAGRAFARRLATPAGLDPYTAQHREVSRETRIVGEAPVRVDANESPLAWLARRRDRDGQPFLDTAALEAGERFRRDVTVAQMLPSVTSNWSTQGAGGGDPHHRLQPSEMALAARQRIDRALDVLGPDFAGVAMDACGFVKKLETIESERGWPARSAKVVLRMALAQLARHYGLAASVTGPARSRGVGHWGAADYRPKM